MLRFPRFVSLWLLAACALCAAGCSRRTPSKSAPALPGLTVRFLDVGQGDSALLQWQGKAALIDGGPMAATRTVVADLKRYGVRRLDWVIASHPHEDHIGGLIGVVAALPIGHFVDSGLSTASSVQKRMLTELKRRKVPFQVAEAGTTIDLGSGASLAILGPPRPFLSGTDSDPNNNSIVARLDYGGVRILFPGDMEGAERDWIYKRFGSAAGKDPLRADVLKAAHHGSRDATNAYLMKRVAPRFVVISCGAGNDYGHPHTQALRAIQASAGLKDLFRTDLEGVVTLRSDGRTISITPEHPATGNIWAPGNRGRQARASFRWEH
jgi:competence protein ComEC